MLGAREAEREKQGGRGGEKTLLSIWRHPEKDVHRQL